MEREKILMKSNPKIFIDILHELHPIYMDDKIRMGRNFDGGYILSKSILSQSEVLLSLGINNEWSFEEACLGYKKFKFLYMIDDTSSKSTILFHKNRNLITCLYRPFNKEIRKNYQRIKDQLNSFLKLELLAKTKYLRHRIGTGPQEISLENFFNQYNLKGKNNILLKIDIEGSEYQIIDSIIRLNEHFSGLVIEFHNVLKDPNLFYESLIKLKTCFMPFHVHLNNYTERNEYLSDALEVSFCLKKNTIRYDSYSFPIPGLDYPCNPEKEDYTITFNKEQQYI